MHARRGPTRHAAIGLLLLLLAGPALVACGGPAPVPATSAPAPVPATSAPVPVPATGPPATGAPATPEALGSPITGRLVALESDGLTKVRGFTMRMADGREVAFTMGPVDNAAEFPPGHLAEHMASSQLVRAYFREESGVRVVYRLEDGE